MAGEGDAFILLILACIFPPAAAGFVAGCGFDLCINILLTLLGYFPGCLHAFWLILKRAEANERYGYKNWTYSGMGEYAGHAGPPSAQPSAPYGQAQAPPPQPPGQYPAPPPGQAPVDQKAGYAPPPAGQYPAPPPSQAPVDQKAGYAPPPAPQGESKSGDYQAADQKGGYAPPPAPVDQKDSGYQAPPQQAPVDQKQTDATTQSPAPPGGN